MGSNWQWEVPLGLDDVSGRLHESIDDEVVVWLRGPGYSYHRRFPAIKGDAVFFHIKSIRPLPSVIGNEGRNSPMHSENYNCDMPLLTRSNAFEFGMGGCRARESTEEEDRTCDPVSSDCKLFFGESYGEKWLDDLCDEMNN